MIFWTRYALFVCRVISGFSKRTLVNYSFHEDDSMTEEAILKAEEELKRRLAAEALAARAPVLMRR